MRNSAPPRKVVLHPAEVLRQAAVLSPESWGASPAEVERAYKMLVKAHEIGIPLYLVGWPDGVRIALTTLLPPDTAAWAQGIVKGYKAYVRGMRGIHRSSQV